MVWGNHQSNPKGIETNGPKKWSLTSYLLQDKVTSPT
jgi:hypothetical protein